MGVVNVTPDSFSDGGLYLDTDKAVARARELLNEGADIIDVGGESTRPGATVAESASEATVSRVPVSEEEEIGRVTPVIRALKRLQPHAIISIDTYKSAVAREAVKAGAQIVNDISGFRWDARMAKTVAEMKVGAVLMHTRGRPD